MIYIVKVLIGRSVYALDRPFTYYSEKEGIHEGMRVLVSFSQSKSTIAFVIEEPECVDSTIEEYQKKVGMKISKIQSVLDEKPLLNKDLLLLARQISKYYQCDLIKVLQTMLPPSLKPKDSALKKAGKKTVDFVFAMTYDASTLSKNEKTLYEKVQKEKNGIKKSDISAKSSLEKLLEKGALEIQQIPVSRIPEMVTENLIPYQLTIEQEDVYHKVLVEDKKVFLLQGVTGSGKTEVYIHLAETMLKENKGVLILVPEIALTDRMLYLLKCHFKDAISILNSSLSDSRKYDEYQKILSGQAKVVLGTRSAVFAPVQNLSLIIIDEEHSNSYKQDKSPYYDAVRVSIMRSENENLKVLLASATPRIIDKARAEKGIYYPLYMNKRIAKSQEKEIVFVNMNDPSSLAPEKSSMFSIRLIHELEENLKRKEQSMVLINRRGYSPVYICRNCHKTVLCPNCGIPLNYHKRDDSLHCHHCGYKMTTIGHTCECGGKDFLTLGYGTERAYEELRYFFPMAKITRLDSDVSSNAVRHQLLDDFAHGETDIIVGTEIISKGHDFPKVTLASILDADSSLRIPSYRANEDTFDLISQFVGRAGRKDLKGRVLLQTYNPDNEVIQLAAKQDYNSFYVKEMEERKKYQYPPYTYLSSVNVKGVDLKEVISMADQIKNYLLKETNGLRFNIYGPSAPYIAHINGRYYRTILIKYKSVDEAMKILSGVNDFRSMTDKVDISIDVDCESENN